MTVTILSGQRTSPQSFRDVETLTAQTTTTATSEAHGQTLDPDVHISQIAYVATSTESRVANVFQLADGIEGQEKWIAMGTATGSASISLTLGVSQDSATAGFTATTALIMEAGDKVGLKFIDEAYHVIYAVGATAGTASSPFA